LTAPLCILPDAEAVSIRAASIVTELAKIALDSKGDLPLLSQVDLPLLGSLNFSVPPSKMTSIGDGLISSGLMSGAFPLTIKTVITKLHMTRFFQRSIFRLRTFTV